ncbi:MAG: hypothetical protein HUJ51_00525 [Eggerthellaceae bacterium]|nr:hypothetical protein [Eggerthellaceae bacterium]
MALSFRGTPVRNHKNRDIGEKLNPIEEAMVNVNKEYSGKFIEAFGSAEGGGGIDKIELLRDQAHPVFKIPFHGSIQLCTTC